MTQVTAKSIVYINLKWLNRNSTFTDKSKKPVKFSEIAHTKATMYQKNYIYTVPLVNKAT